MPPDPASNTVHLYTLSLDPPPSIILNPAEQARASRFARSQDRARFASARTQLRQILASYLGIAPQILEIQQTPQGKPYLHHPLEFNLTHSGSWALLAVTTGIPVGVDLESHRPLEDLDDLARQIMSPAELSTFRTIPPAARQTAFYALWTRKESFLKALGTGLQLDPSAIHLADSAQITHQGTVWSIQQIPSPPDTSAALATQGPAPTVIHQTHTKP